MEKRKLARAIEEQLRRRKENGIKYYEPQEQQLPFHLSKKRIRLILGGNRAGKTIAAMTEAIWYALGKHPYKEIETPNYGRIVGMDFTNAVEKVLLPELRKWMPKDAIIKYAIEPRTLYLKGGSFIEFMSGDQEVKKFESSSRHWIYFDEEPSREIFKANQMRVIDTEGDIWFAMTPLEGMTWSYNELYEQAGINPNIDVFVFDTELNPYLNQDIVKEIKNGLSEFEVEARIHGKYIQKSGLIYKEYSSDVHDINPFPIPRNWIKICSIDPHPRMSTVVVYMAIAPYKYFKAEARNAGINLPEMANIGENDDIYVVYDEVYPDKPLLISETCSLMAAKEKGAAIAYRLIDNSANTPDPIIGRTVKQEFEKNGVRTILADKDVNNRIFTVRERLQKRTIFFMEVPKTIWEIRHYCYDDQTEVLTNEGWKLFKDLNKKETIATLNPKTWELEYHVPTEYIAYSHTGDMLFCESKCTNFCVTPDHKLYGTDICTWEKTKNPKVFKTATINEFNKKQLVVKKNVDLWNGKEMEFFEIDNKKIPISDWLKFFGLYISEGYSHIEQNQVTISQEKTSKYFKEVEDAVFKIPFNFRYDGFKFYTYDKTLHDYLFTFGKSKTKHIPSWIKNLSIALLKDLLRGLMVGDGTIYNNEYGKNNKYKTSSKKLVDDVQEIALKVGLHGNIYQYNSYYDFVFSNSNGNAVVKHVERTNYSGMVYCVTVSNHIIYVRRKGKALWCGNCWEDYKIGGDRDVKEKPKKKRDHAIDNVGYMCVSRPTYYRPEIYVPDRKTVCQTTGY